MDVGHGGHVVMIREKKQKRNNKYACNRVFIADDVWLNLGLARGGTK